VYQFRHSLIHFLKGDLVLRGLFALRDDPHRDRMMMKSPTALVTAALVAAIILAASFLIAAGTRGEDAPLLKAPSYDHS
jgi:hypothetical protein